MKDVLKVFLVNTAAGAGTIVGLVGGLMLSAEMIDKRTKKKKGSEENISSEGETA